MKVKLSEDEWWPVFSVTKKGSYGEEYDIPEDMIKKLNDSMKSFTKIQTQIFQIVKEQSK